jgi:hypothetical protein
MSNAKKCILAMILLSAAILATGCRVCSGNTYYVVSKHYGLHDGQKVGVVVLIRNGFFKSNPPDGPRIVSYFPVKNYPYLMKKKYYYKKELAKLGISVPDKVLSEDEVTYLIPDSEMRYVEHKTASPEQSITNYYRVTDKLPHKGVLLVFFHRIFARLNKDGNPTFIEDKSVLYRFSTDDPNTYAYFEQGEKYCAEQPPLAAVADKLEKIQPIVEKPDEK